jgi:hypothetical protein
MGMQRAELIPLSITEAAISHYGTVALAVWAYAKHHTRASGGVVYKSFTAQRGGKFGWSRSTFFTRMKSLEERGLAVRCEHGWILAKTRAVVGTHKGRGVKHKCTLLLPPKCSEQYVRDTITLKLMEMGWRQRDRYFLTPLQRFEAGRINVKTCCREIRQLSDKSAQSLNTGLMGSTPDELLNCAQNGWMPMNTERLMEVTGMGRAAMFAWKRRAKERGWFDQMDRRFDIPAYLKPGLPVMYEQWEAQCRGKVSWGEVPYFHQASMYKLNLTY